MSEPTVNIPLLRKAVEWAEAEAAKPFEVREWNQFYWKLPPSAAQTTPHLFGIDSGQPKAEACGTCYCIAGYAAEVQGAAARTSDIPVVARKALGLTEFQANQLFNANNTIEDVRRIAEDIAGESL